MRNIQHKLKQQHARQRYRTRRLRQPSDQIIFNSNDYLGLSQHPKLKKACIQGISQYGAGSGASHLVSGYLPVHQTTEQAYAEFLQRDRALLFANGYMANLGVISTLANRESLVIHDRSNHASLYDATKLAQANLVRYPHLNLNALTTLLTESHAAHKLLVNEAIFSMLGSQADLPELVNIAQKYTCDLMIDDAHGIGVIGPQGGGSVLAAKLDQQAVPILVCPLGKAMGCYGAIVAGSEDFIEYLIQFARSYTYTTAPPAAHACTALASLEVCQQEDWRREKLQALIHFFRAQAQQRELPLGESQTPIQPIIIGENADAMQVSQQLQQQGIWVSAFRPPTVESKQALLRISLNVTHTEHQITCLLNAIRSLL